MDGTFALSGFEFLSASSHPTPLSSSSHRTYTKVPSNKLPRKEKSDPLDQVMASFRRTTYTYSLLTSDRIPEHLDRKKLENYLSDKEFEQIFDMTREHYNTLPEWKKLILRKDKRLY